MKTGKLLVFSLALCAAMAAFAFYAAASLPPGAELPTHWNAAGEVDDTMPALQALLFPVGMALFLSAVFALVPRLEPLQNRLEASATLLRTAWLGTLLLMIFVQLLVAAPVFGIAADGHVVLLPVGLLFLFLGNVLPKSRPGYFVGIRTPWTIVDEDVWIATHRLGGKLMMLAGLVLMILALAPANAESRVWISVGAILTAVLVPAGYSWWLWHRKTHRA